MSPVVCVGEDRRGAADGAIKAVGGQLDGLLGSVAPLDLRQVVIAYEPRWAIGAGASAADPSEVAAVHAAIHAWCDSRLGGGVAAGSSRVIYGGSVDADAAAALLARPGVEGLFVGRASLDPAVFARIARAPIVVDADRALRAPR
jgi:triosephosphate isomerase